MGIGSRIKEILKEQNKSIKWLAEKSGVSKNTLYTITKRDSTRVEISTLERIATSLDVQIKDLLQSENEYDRVATHSMLHLPAAKAVEIADKRKEIWGILGFSLENPPSTDKDRKEISQAYDLDDLMKLYDSLNEEGKYQARNQVKLVAKIPEYKKED